MLMVNRSQNCQLLGHDAHAAANGNEHFAHDKITPGLVGTAEIDHQCLSEYVQWDRDLKKPLESTSLSD
jgi:hypothetical protein